MALNIFLFGSCVNNNYNESSDIDLAIVLKDKIDEFDEQINLMKLRRKVDLRIEPHPFNEKDFNKNNPFINEIINSREKIL